MKMFKNNKFTLYPQALNTSLFSKIGLSRLGLLCNASPFKLNASNKKLSTVFKKIYLGRRYSTVSINSKDILDNYKENRLPLELLDFIFSFSTWFIVGFYEAEGNLYIY